MISEAKPFLDACLHPGGHGFNFTLRQNWKINNSPWLTFQFSLNLISRRKKKFWNIKAANLILTPSPTYVHDSLQMGYTNMGTSPYVSKTSKGTDVLDFSPLEKKKKRNPLDSRFICCIRNFIELLTTSHVILWNPYCVQCYTWTSSYCVISYLDIIVLCHIIPGHHHTVSCHTWTSSYCVVSYLDIIILCRVILGHHHTVFNQSYGQPAYNLHFIHLYLGGIHNKAAGQLWFTGTDASIQIMSLFLESLLLRLQSHIVKWNDRQ